METSRADSGPVAAADPEALIARFQELSERIERIDDPLARRSSEELVSVVLDLYGEGLRRIFAELAEAGEDAAAIRERLAGDGVVASLMLIHDLYPVPLDQRVAEALDSVRPYMESHGGDVELVSLDDGVARIRLSGSCDGCPASASTLELAIKAALDEHAPDLVALEVDGGIAAGGLDAEPSGMELPIVQVSNGNVPAAGGTFATAEPAPGLSQWFPLEGTSRLEDGELTVTTAAGASLVVANVEGTLLAYANACAACGAALAGATLIEGVLGCPECDRRFFLPRAGRSLDDDGLQLEPVPLLREGGAVRVAIAR